MKLGFGEILVICVVALFVIGPDKLPYYAQKLGEALKEVRKATSGISQEIKENIVEPLDEAAKPIKEAVEPLTDLKKEMDASVKDIQKSFNDIGKTEPTKEAEKKETTEIKEPVVEETKTESEETEIK